MKFVDTNKAGGIATLTLNRGKVNPLNGEVVDELLSSLKSIEGDDSVNAVILTGHGKFFSFGFDVPELLTYSKKTFSDFISRFTDLYSYMFLYPKPVIAAINGHAIAGGCMLAITCDHRIMVSEKAKISLNEIDLGVPVFSAITEILRFCVGSQNAAEILYSGALYAAEGAHALGLVNEIVTPADLMNTAAKSASEFGRKPGPAFSGIKSLLRRPVLDGISQKENESIQTFIDTWHSETARAILSKVEIY